MQECEILDLRECDSFLDGRPREERIEVRSQFALDGQFLQRTQSLKESRYFPCHVRDLIGADEEGVVVDTEAFDVG